MCEYKGNCPLEIRLTGDGGMCQEEKPYLTDYTLCPQFEINQCYQKGVLLPAPPPRPADDPSHPDDLR